MNKVLLNKEELVEKLRQLAKTIDKNPTRLDVELEEDFPSAKVFESAFGSFNNALIAAGLKINKPGIKAPKRPPKKPKPQFSKLSDEELLDLLRLKAKELKETPTWAEITLDKRFPSPATIARRFGTYNDAIVAAGLKPNEFRTRRRKHHKKAP